MIKPYAGCLSTDQIHGPVKTAYRSWIDQRQRCNNPDSKYFRHYGAKGLTVDYSSREFVGWWLHELKKFKGDRPTCGRIDHSKGYHFGNIKMESASDNWKETAIRNKTGGRNRLPALVYKYGTNKVVGKFESMRKAAIHFGVDSAQAYRSAQNRSAYCKGYSFAYV